MPRSLGLQTGIRRVLASEPTNSAEAGAGGGGRAWKRMAQGQELFCPPRLGAEMCCLLPAACYLNQARSESCQKGCEPIPHRGENISKGHMAHLENGEF